MSACTICNRVMCDHLPAERGQTMEEMMSEGPRPFVVVAMVDLREGDRRPSIRSMKMDVVRYEQILKLVTTTKSHAFGGLVFSVSAAAYYEGTLKEMEE